jgi:ParB/RepB/Spo0J family partition protein
VNILNDRNIVQLVPVADIRRGDNDRTVFDQTALEELAASIKARADKYQEETGEPHRGLKSPVILRLFPTGELVLVAGERRTRAVRDVLGWPVIEAFVYKMDDEEAEAVMLIENTARVDLNPMDEANAYNKRIDAGWTVEKLVSTTGKSTDLIRRRLSLRRLHPDVQHLVRNRHMPLGHAEAMVDLDLTRQLIAMRVFQSGKSVPLTTFIRLVSELYEQQSQDSLFDLESFWIEQVQAPTPVFRGKRTQVPVLTDTNLPPIPLAPASTKGETASTVFLRYVTLLQDEGYTAEASVLGTMYETLVQANLLKLPVKDTQTLLAEARAILQGVKS